VKELGQIIDDDLTEFLLLLSWMDVDLIAVISLSPVIAEDVKSARRVIVSLLYRTLKKEANAIDQCPCNVIFLSQMK